MSVTRNLNRAFGNYQIEQKIGVGGMAAVYRAYDPIHERRVALKVLHTLLVTDNNNLELKRRFQREAHIISQLDHPNIVHIYDYGDFNGTPYLVMEYMARGSLAQRFDEPISISLKTSALLLSHIASGLDYAHSRGIIHRDLKLENILLDDYNRPALADFGIARVRDATRLTATRVIVGTPLTMSPEQALGEPTIDHRSDLYSLAVMAYLMATGFFPFTGEEALAILHKHLSAVAPLPSQINHELPRALDMVLLKGLAKQPDDRYQSAEEFAVAFNEAATHVPIHTTSFIQVREPNPIAPVITQMLTSVGNGIASPNLKTVMLPKSGRRRWLSAAGIAAMFLVGLFAILGGRPENPAVAQAPSATPTLFDPDGTVSFFMAQTIAAYTDTPTPSPTIPATDTPSPTLTLSPTVTATPTQTDTPSPTFTPSPTPFGDAEVISRVNINVRRGPSTDYPVRFGLKPGTQVKLIGRSRNALWLQINTQDAREGWVVASLLQASIDVLTLPVIWVAPVSTATVAPPAFVASPTQPRPSSGGGGGSTTSGGGGGGTGSTRVPPTQPPQPTNTSQPAILILFYASPDHIDAGSCSTLYWSVSNAEEVYLDGALVGFSSNSTVCPGSDTTYTLSARRNSDGAYSEAYATIYVNVPPPPPTPSPESTQQAIPDDAG